MRRYGTLTALALAGCSLIVPAEDEFTYDLADGGGPPIDSGSDRDAEVRFDGGADAGPACGAEETRCDGTCVDTQSSLQHCGDCGNACAPTDRCDAGACYDPVLEVAAGFGHTCARRASGQVWCWGLNANGQLGDGTTLDRLTPVRVLSTTDAAQVVVGFGLNRFELTYWGWSCLRSAEGSVRCWGANALGQLGDGTMEPRRQPVDVAGLGTAQDISSGRLVENCAVSTDSQLYCWGGTDSETAMPNAPYPLAPTGTTGAWAAQVELGATTGCVVGTDTRAFCWGFNAAGEVGDGTTEARDFPTAVVGLSVVIGVSAASQASCALLSDATVACWGREDALGAGLRTENAHPSPEPVPDLSDVVAIDALGETCAIHGTERRVSCWGEVVTEVEGLNGVVDLGVGTAHTCAVLEDGSVQCWGSNEAGQLGDGTTDDRATPTPVVGLR